MTLMDDFEKNIKISFYPGKGRTIAFFSMVYHRATIKGFTIGKGTDGKLFVGVPKYSNQSKTKTFFFDDYLDWIAFKKFTIRKYEEWKNNMQKLEKGVTAQ